MVKKYFSNNIKYQNVIIIKLIKCYNNKINNNTLRVFQFYYKMIVYKSYLQNNLYDDTNSYNYKTISFYKEKSKGVRITS